jgi:hypothetical protein
LIKEEKYMLIYKMNKEELYSHLKEFIGRPNNEKTKLAIKEKLFKLCENSIDNYK